MPSANVVLFKASLCQRVVILDSSEVFTQFWLSSVFMEEPLYF